MTNYLKPGDPDSFLGYEIKEQRTPEYVLCPVCSGHGGWNLRVHAYGPDRHFRAHCDQCSGYGWTRPENAKCVHEWKFVANLGRCYNQYQCTKCGMKQNVDSGD